MISNEKIGQALTIKLDATLPPPPSFQKGIRRAPSRGFHLTKAQTTTALKNALRYVPESLHDKLADEFLQELYMNTRESALQEKPFKS